MYTGLVLVLGTAATTLEADSIYLRNGRRVDCTIYGQTRNSLRCRTATGKKLQFQKRRIRRVSYGKTAGASAAEIGRRESAARRRAEQKRAAERRALEKRAAEETRRRARAREIAMARKIAVARKLEDKRKRKTARGGHISTGDALLRSFVLPGWGQAARGHTWRGALLGGGFLLAASGAVVFKGRHTNAKAVYDESARNALLVSGSDGGTGLLLGESTVAADQASMARAAAGFQAAAGLAAIIYIYSIVDAYFFTRRLPRSTRLASEGEIDDGKKGTFNLYISTHPDDSRRESSSLEERFDLRYTMRF